MEILCLGLESAVNSFHIVQQEVWQQKFELLFALSCESQTDLKNKTYVMERILKVKVYMRYVSHLHTIQANRLYATEVKK